LSAEPADAGSARIRPQDRCRSPRPRLHLDRRGLRDGRREAPTTQVRERAPTSRFRWPWSQKGAL